MNIYKRHIQLIMDHVCSLFLRSIRIFRSLALTRTNNLHDLKNRVRNDNFIKARKGSVFVSSKYINYGIYI